MTNNGNNGKEKLNHNNIAIRSTLIHQSHIDTRRRLLWHSSSAFTVCAAFLFLSHSLSVSSHFCFVPFSFAWLLFCLRISLIVCSTFLSNKLSFWAIYCQYYSFFIVLNVALQNTNRSHFSIALFRFPNAHFRFFFCTSIAHHSLQQHKWTGVRYRKIELADTVSERKSESLRVETKEKKKKHSLKCILLLCLLMNIECNCAYI